MTWKQFWNRAQWVIAAVILGILALTLWKAFSCAGMAAEYSACRSEVDASGMALMAYAEGHDGKLPTASQWKEAVLAEATDETFVCPGRGSNVEINPQVIGKSVNKLDTAEALTVEVPDNLVESFQKGGSPSDGVKGRLLFYSTIGGATYLRRDPLDSREPAHR